MRRSGKGSGGGIGMNKVTHRSAPKTEPRPHKVHPGGVAQLGQSQGDHITNKSSTGYRGDPFYRGTGYATPVGISDPVKAVGVGGGREIHKTGSQSQYGSGGPQKPAGRDILGAFGPESSRGR